MHYRSVLTFFLALFLAIGFSLSASPEVLADAYRYCGLSAKGKNDGSSWENQWAYNDSDLDTKMQALAHNQAAYLFIDGGSSSLIYSGQLSQGPPWGGWVNASGSSSDYRIYIMPGYAADKMGVPGSHGGHTGTVIFDAQGGSDIAFRFYGSAHITMDGYSDPRPIGGHAPKLILKNRSANEGMITVISGCSDIVIRNVELHKMGSRQYIGDCIHIKNSVTVLVENCYIHDAGFPGVGYAGIWTDDVDNFRSRYNQFLNIGANGGEGVGDYTSHYSGTGYMDVQYNLFQNVDVPVRGYKTVRNNTFVDCRHGWSHSTANETYRSANKYFENNFLFRVQDEITTESGTNINVSNLYLRNNTFSDNSIYIRLDSSGGFTDTRADALNARDYASDNNHGENRTEIFMNYENGDFRLSAGAAECINVGREWPAAPSRDIVGNQISQAIDIGAFEHASQPISLLNPPTGVHIVTSK